MTADKAAVAARRAAASGRRRARGHSQVRRSCHGDGACGAPSATGVSDVRRSKATRRIGSLKTEDQISRPGCCACSVVRAPPHNGPSLRRAGLPENSDGPRCARASVAELQPSRHQSRRADHDVRATPSGNAALRYHGGALASMAKRPQRADFELFDQWCRKSYILALQTRQWGTPSCATGWQRRRCARAPHGVYRSAGPDHSQLMKPCDLMHQWGRSPMRRRRHKPAGVPLV